MTTCGSLSSGSTFWLVIIVSVCFVLFGLWWEVAEIHTMTCCFVKWPHLVAALSRVTQVLVTTVSRCGPPTWLRSGQPGQGRYIQAVKWLTLPWSVYCSQRLLRFFAMCSRSVAHNPSEYRKSNSCMASLISVQYLQYFQVSYSFQETTDVYKLCKCLVCKLKVWHPAPKPSVLFLFVFFLFCSFFCGLFLCVWKAVVWGTLFEM